ncbi:unnamed protein product [Diabrotica balteata]|uniref:Uncharacterized protein n=1 Tax=Diabrotica balteata TaxID=107213 RepID=A0A9P0E0Q7_DIABA|nr:unnamed protein product [Diabrotica balteata]
MAQNQVDTTTQKGAQNDVHIYKHNCIENDDLFSKLDLTKRVGHGRPVITDLPVELPLLYPHGRPITKEKKFFFKVKN